VSEANGLNHLLGRAADWFRTNIANGFSSVSFVVTEPVYFDGM